MAEQKHGRGWTRGNAINGKRRKDERRAAAFERQAAFNKLSLEQKLAGLPKDGANRQRARYLKQIEARKKSEETKQAKKKEAKVTVGNS